MSDAKKCDRCGKLYEIYNGVEYKKFRQKFDWVEIRGGMSDPRRGFDLCEDCMMDLIDWLGEVEK